LGTKGKVTVHIRAFVAKNTCSNLHKLNCRG